MRIFDALCRTGIVLRKINGRKARRRIAILAPTLSPFVSLVIALPVIFLAIAPIKAGGFEEGRIAIIHSAESTIINNEKQSRGVVENEPKLLKQLRDLGVLVVGRYLARCFQPNNPTKTLIRGGPDGQLSELNAIFEAKLAVVSIYQYRADDKEGEQKFTQGVSDEGRNCEATPSVRDITNRRSRVKPEKWNPADEATLDAEAAVAQADRLGQPKNTAIYFGVDYPYKATKREQDGIKAYFKRVHEILTRRERPYRVGAYGSGAVLQMLMNDGSIDYRWLSPSRSYAGTTEFYNNGDWHLAQIQWENQIVLASNDQCLQYEHDVDVQNPRYSGEDVGFWFRDLSYRVAEDRTSKIFAQRRFVCSTRDVKRVPKTKTCPYLPQQAKECSKEADCIGLSVRIMPGDENSLNPKVDVWDNGRYELAIPMQRLTRSFAVRPYFYSSNRVSAKCTCAGSDASQPCDQSFR